MYAAAAVAVRLLATSRLDRVGTSVILVPSTLALALQFVVLAAVPSETGMIVAGAIGGVGHGLMFPLLSTMVVDRATAEERGTALAVFSGVFDAVVLFGAPALGVLIEVTGYAASFLAVAATIVAGIVGFLIWERALETPVSDPPRSG